MQNFEEQLFADLDRFHMIPDEALVIAGVSGGADSVAMLLGLKDYIDVRTRQGKCRNVKLKAVHVEHGMRGETSVGDAAFVAELCERLQIPCSVHRIRMREEAERRGMSLEEAGRACRYEIFEQETGSARINRIAVAHNMDDQAETVLMNLSRGSGIRGMGGIAPVRNNIIRPLLGVSRASIEAYLSERGQDWRTDESNLEPEFTRNKVRLELLPWLKKEVNAGAAEHIARTASLIREADAYLERETVRAAAQCCRVTEKTAFIDTEKFYALDPLLRRYLLRHAIVQAGDMKGLKDVTAEHLEALERLAGMQSGRKLSLPGQLRAYRTGKQLVITFKPEEDSRITDEIVISEDGTYQLGSKKFTVAFLPGDLSQVERSECTKWISYDTIQGVLTLRSRKSGDYIVTDAQGGKTKLKKYMIDSKIPAEERGNVILAADGSRILWIVGYRTGEDTKITASTQRMVRITVEKTEG